MTEKEINFDHKEAMRLPVIDSTKSTQKRLELRENLKQNMAPKPMDSPEPSYRSNVSTVPKSPIVGKRRGGILSARQKSPELDIAKSPVSNHKFGESDGKESLSSQIKEALIPTAAESPPESETTKVDPGKFHLALPTNIPNSGNNSKKGSPSNSKRMPNGSATGSKRETDDVSDLDTERHLFEKIEKKPLKTRIIQNIKFLNDHRKSMLIFNASELKKEEPANKKIIFSTYLKPLIMSIIGAFMFTSIVMSSIGKLGLLKS